jgi:hypothetical protein
MKRVLLLTFLLALITASSFSQTDRFWSANKENRNNITTDKAVSRLTYPASFRLFNVNIQPLREQLFSVVDKGSSNQSAIISLPNADGNIEQFLVFEASNFEPALQSQFPMIRAFSGRGITDKSATLKLSISPQGIQTMVFRADKGNEFIEPYSQDHNVYSVYRSHRDKGKLPWTCSTQEQEYANDLQLQMPVSSATGSSTGQLKTMRLAQSCNGEYANWFGATSSAQVDLVLAAFNATLTRCNGVYEKDLALHLNLIANTTAVIYYNPATDPYTTLSNWNNQLQSALNANIGDANYDIGHMFGASGGGGNAGCIGCVCVNGSKGRGITSPADGIPMGDNFDIDYVAHEVGHQLGGNHTFSMSLEGTGQNKEVGSGITIMGYAGITSQDVAPHSIDIFHETSIAQIQANLATKTCPVSIDITANNVAPVIAPVSNYTIPISTPFALTGSATDANTADILTYCWEQNDNSTTSGSGSVASPTKATGPNWLSFPASTSGTRLFPKLSTILAGLNVTPPLPGGDAVANIEALSSVSRNLNFRLTVRDNSPYIPDVSIGQTAFTDLTVTVTNTSGPFSVTAPNTAVTWDAGSAATITWSVNGTNTGLVNCATVNILLSTDGGNTFSTVLAAATANDGSEVITVPSTLSNTCRIKVEAVGNIFFDISNADFIIGEPPVCGAVTGLTASSITLNSGTVSWTAVSGADSYDVDYKESTSSTWINAATATTLTSIDLTGLSENTTYDWRIRVNCTAGTGNYVNAQFTTLAPCNAPTGLGSSAITSSSATVSWSAVSGAANYDVDYKDASSSTWVNAVTATTSTSRNITGLIASTLYDWRVRANCTSGLTSNYSQAQFTTSAVVVCPGPYDVSTNGSISGAATIPLNTDIKGLINPSGDNDYYKFIITTGGTITMTLTTLPANYHLRLLNSSGSTLQTSNNGGTNNETINRTVSAGTYYARVYPSNSSNWNASNCYTLRVQTGTASKGDENLQFVTNEISVFPNPTGYMVNLGFNAKDGGNAIISIINQTGTAVLTKTVAVTEGENTRKLDVSLLANGMYFVKIQSGADVQMAKIIIKK